MGSASSTLKSKSKKMFSSEASTAGAEDALIEETISSHPVVIWSKSYCPYCVAAKNAIAQASSDVSDFQEPFVVELDMRRDGGAIQSALARRTGRRTVPNVFIDGKAVGGGDDMASLQRQGALSGVIAAAVEAHKQKTSAAAAAPPVPAALTPVDTAKATVRKLVSTNPVVVFSKSWCPHSTAAKEAVANSGAKVAEFGTPVIVELDKRDDGADIQEALESLTGRSTVPNVFVGGKSIGGGDETSRLDSEGVLAQMIRAAPDQLSAESDAAGESEDLKPVARVADAEKLITFGAGCFWGVELAFQRVPGVTKTEVGYSNGKFSPVSYDAVCTGASGHAEVVRVFYNPAEVAVEDLLKLWEQRHDVTSLNKQGNDRGTQYRSAIFYPSQDGEEQKAAALAWKAAAEGKMGMKKVVTEIAEESGYNAAEEFHQQYLERKGQDASKGATSHIRCYG